MWRKHADLHTVRVLIVASHEVLPVPRLASVVSVARNYNRRWVNSVDHIQVGGGADKHGEGTGCSTLGLMVRQQRPTHSATTVRRGEPSGGIAFDETLHDHVG